MFIVTVTEPLRFKHRLVSYPGYEKPHEHQWMVTVKIKREEIDETGISWDFIKVRKELKKVLSLLHRKDLNKIDFFKDNPTAERIALFISQRISLPVCEVSVGDEKEKVTLIIK